MSTTQTNVSATSVVSLRLQLPDLHPDGHLSVLVPLFHLSDFQLFLSAKDRQEVAQLWYGEGIPLEIELVRNNYPSQSLLSFIN